MIDNAEQQKALELFDTGASMFITGDAGTGKSTLLRKMYNLRPETIVVAAPTGVAAINVGGVTLHSLFSIPFNYTPVEDLEEFKSKNRQILRAASSVFIDEISMVRSDLMSIIDARLKDVMNSKMPFGGKQMVFFGDLAQLPPVVREREVKKALDDVYGGPYAFLAPCVKRAKIHLIELTHIYRQSGDPEFIDALNHIRRGVASDALLSYLNESVTPMHDQSEKSKKIILTSTNKSSDETNFSRLRALPSKSIWLEGEEENDTRSPFKDAPVDLEMEMKENARIMILVNDRENAKYINGTTGKFLSYDETRNEVEVVTDEGDILWLPQHEWKKIKYEVTKEKVYVNEEGDAWEDGSKYKSVDRLKPVTVASLKQFPIKLAWAMTIHKSQGKTFSDLHIDFGNYVFAHGQAYVALSRAINKEGITLERALTASDIWIDPLASTYRDYFVVERCVECGAPSEIDHAVVPGGQFIVKLCGECAGKIS